MDALLTLLRGIRAPEIAADKLIADGEFESLGKHPRWRELERIRQTRTGGHTDPDR